MTEIDTHSYELVYIVRPDYGDDGINTLNERLKQVISAQSGEVQTTELWGKRNLAYRIGKSSEVAHIFIPAEGKEWRRHPSATGHAPAK